MKKYTYALYDKNWEKKKTVVCTDQDPAGKAIELLMRLKGIHVPQYIEKIGIIVEEIEDVKDADV